MSNRLRVRRLADLPLIRQLANPKKGMRARQESNPQPCGPKPPALSIELRAPIYPHKLYHLWLEMSLKIRRLL